MKNLLKNKYMLYFVLFVAVSNILGYLSIGDDKSLMVFIGLAGLTSYFSKNMIVILGAAIVGTNVIYANRFMREGMANGASANQIKQAAKKAKTKKSEAFTQKNVPTSKPKKVRPATEEEEEEDEVADASRVDYAATMEQAYDNLNKMLGEGGMKNLTKDTQGLMDQQKQLMKQLEDFAPLMEQAGSMLDKLGGMDNLQGLMGKLGNISGLAGGKKKN